MDFSIVAAPSSTYVRIAAATMMAAAIRRLRRDRRLSRVLIANTPSGDVIAEIDDLPPECWPVAAQTLQLSAQGWLIVYHIGETWIRSPSEEAILIECCFPEGEICSYIQPFTRDRHRVPYFIRAPFFLEDNGRVVGQIFGVYQRHTVHTNVM
jgi:hypothetical protein